MLRNDQCIEEAERGKQVTIVAWTKKLDGELQWRRHPNLDTSSTFLVENDRFFSSWYYFIALSFYTSTNLFMGRTLSFYQYIKS